MEKIQMLLQEQGITIAPILAAIEMAIGVLVEALLPGGGEGGGGKSPYNDEAGVNKST